MKVFLLKQLRASRCRFIVFPHHTAEEYEDRRKEVMEMLPDKSVLVVPSYGVKYGSQNIL
jgi:hypothetical protein